MVSFISFVTAVQHFADAESKLCSSTHSTFISLMVYSCYSILLLKYLSECKRHGRECHIRAVLLISIIWDLKATDDIIHQPLNKYTLNRHLSNNFKGILRE